MSGLCSAVLLVAAVTTLQQLSLTWRSVEQLPPSPPVVLSVLNANGSQPLASRGVGLIAGKDATTLLGDVLGCGHQLLSIWVAGLWAMGMRFVKKPWGQVIVFVYLTKFLSITVSVPERMYHTVRTFYARNVQELQNLYMARTSLM